ncbi:hypothetical protein V8J36_04615 [Frigidibacter sp. MR17.14]|uniref:hypothetical protein n=1 Tax=Frigidibacter sp. MR17.14 TaxID=3126509 RepID=UPI0030131969
MRRRITVRRMAGPACGLALALAIAWCGALIARPGPRPHALPVGITEVSAPLHGPSMRLVPVLAVPGDLAKVARGAGLPPVLAALPDEGGPCEPSLRLGARKAVLTLSIKAECLAGRRVFISHESLGFALTVPAAGRALVELPALAGTAVVRLRLPDGRLREVATIATQAGTRAIAGLRWQAGEALALNVYENRAEFGAPGHLRAARGANGGGARGRLFLLGDADEPGEMLTALYLAPSGEGAARLELEALSGPGVCGRPLAAEALSAPVGAALRAVPLSLSLPACGGDPAWVLLPLGTLGPQRLAEAG